MKTTSSNYHASISELENNPALIIKRAESGPVAILENNKPTAYLLSATTYEKISDTLDDIKLAELIAERKNSKEIEVSLS